MIMMGPISGLGLPGSSRLEFCARSPLTGIWGEASMGGHFAPSSMPPATTASSSPARRQAGLSLCHRQGGGDTRRLPPLGQGRLRDRGTAREGGGRQASQVVCIGQGGENLVRYAGIVNDKGSLHRRPHRHGRGDGLQEAQGRGGQGQAEAQHRQRRGVQGSCATRLAKEPKSSMVAEGLGLSAPTSTWRYGMAIGDVPTKNWTKAYWANGPKNWPRSVSGRDPSEPLLLCLPCGCKRIVRGRRAAFRDRRGAGARSTRRGGHGHGHHGGRPGRQHQGQRALRPLGIDVISTGATIAWAIEAYEKGILTEKETGGMKLEWGNPEAAHRFGHHDRQARGYRGRPGRGHPRRFRKKYGGTEFAIHVKGHGGAPCTTRAPSGAWR